ncbi:MAG: hypothetical protein H5T71_00115 [Chloroflexi bacterium]|nr:hypothetical protein [Chloroflexota bacterium]
MNGELPADVLKELRIAKGYSSRREFANAVKRGWTEEIVRNLESFKDELPRTLFTIEHLYALYAAKIIAEGDAWDVRLKKAMDNQAKLVASKKGRRASSEWSSAPDEAKTPEAADPSYQEDGDPLGQPAGVGEGAGGAQASTQRPRRWLAILAVLAVLGAAGSCFAGTRLARLLGPRPTPTSPKVVYQVVTATPNPQNALASSPEVTPKVEYRVVTATPGPTEPTATPEVQVIIVTATPPPVTPTPKPTNTLAPTNTPTIQPTAIPLPFEDDFSDIMRPEWQVLSGDWRVIDGKLTTVNQGDAQSIILVGDQTWSDYAVYVDVTRNAWRPVFSIVVRYQDEANMVALKNNGCCSSVVQVCNNGKWVQVGEDLPTMEGTIRIEVKKDLYRIYFDNKLIRTFNEPSLLSGRVGLTRENNDAVYFDNVKVIPLQ